MAKSFVKPFKRDCVYVHDRPNALTLQLDEAEPERLEFTVKVGCPALTISMSIDGD
jgi:hypothetical protein